jgi:hypothetical protein
MPLTSEAARPVVAGYEQRMQMTTALNHLIKRYRDGIMIANLGPADGGQWIGSSSSAFELKNLGDWPL